MRDKLSAEAVRKLMKKVPEWELDDRQIYRTFEFDEYLASIEFVNSVAEIAEDAFHHPDITIGYLQVVVSLTTHDKGGLTESDFEVASRVDSLVD